MSRKSQGQKVIDERSFPITAVFHIPELGFSSVGIDPHTWLRRELGLTEFASHSTRRLSGDCIAVFFRRIADLVRFAEAFPQLALADDTTLPTYTSPHLTLGRR